jgi:hypothetical protein
LDGCDLKGNLAVVYPEGIVAMLKYFKRKMQRAEFREKIVKALKEQVYHTRGLSAGHGQPEGTFCFKTQKFRTLMSTR